jgi:hypothetical protein
MRPGNTAVLFTDAGSEAVIPSHLTRLEAAGKRGRSPPGRRAR